MDKNHPVLLKPIRELSASREFMEMAELNHFENLGQMVAIRALVPEEPGEWPSREPSRLAGTAGAADCPDILRRDAGDGADSVAATPRTHATSTETIDNLSEKEPGPSGITQALTTPDLNPPTARFQCSKE